MRFSDFEFNLREFAGSLGDFGTLIPFLTGYVVINGFDPSGVLVMLGKEPRFHLCRALSQHTVNDSTKSMALLGFIVGVAPCAPLLGILTYIAFSVQDSLLGAAYAFCFGVGTAIITPIVLLGVLSSVVPRLLFKNPKILDIFRRSCGLLLVFFGARLIVDATGYLG